jgi:SAM-dependent methyltransferase
MQKTDYNKIAASYNKRYKVNYLVNIGTEIKNLIASNNYKNILEAGCGTGKWINALDNNNLNVFGLDYSFEMLKVSKTYKSKLNLVNADAVYIPFKDNFFDLIFCVNAIHHFPDKETFIIESKRALTKNGMLAIFGVDPNIDKEWYVYNYFDSVYENDLKRFPTLDYLKVILNKAGYEEIEIKIIEKIYSKRIGTDVLNDPFLGKQQSSQLANLSDEEYERGITKIKNQIKQNPKTVFKTSVIFYLTSARKTKEK